MAEKKSTFWTTENVYKLVIGLIAWLGIVYDQKSDIKNNETANAKDHFFFNYRLTKIEERLDIKQAVNFESPQETQGSPIVMNYHAAILPKEFEPETINCIYE